VLPDLVDRLACPWCRAGGLRLEVGERDGEVVLRGRLRCPACERATVIEDGTWQALGPARPPPTPAQLANRFPPTARVYEAAWRRRSLSLLSGRPFPLEEELAELERWVRPGPGRVVVDVACSEGLYGRRLARAGATVLAVDHARPFLAAVRRRSRAEGVVVVPVLASAQRLPLLDGAADAAVMGGSLNEIGDRATALAELARVLPPGGRAWSMSLVTAAGRRGRAVQRALAPGGVRFDSAGGTAAAFAAAGLVPRGRHLDGLVLRLDLEAEEEVVSPTGPAPAG
jgi:SAM-dependent methyltransferase/uncharacterized protein YbaR (Trm112 family)